MSEDCILISPRRKIRHDGVNLREILQVIVLTLSIDMEFNLC